MYNYTLLDVRILERGADCTISFLPLGINRQDIVSLKFLSLGGLYFLPFFGSCERIPSATARTERKSIENMLKSKRKEGIYTLLAAH